MSNLKINENLFLGKQELNRLVKFLDEDGFRRFFFEDTVSYGFTRNDFSGPFSNGRVELGTNALTIKVNETKIVNKDLNFLYQPDKDNILVPNDGNWYWVQVEFLLSNIEVGTVEIDSQGNLTGVGTEFTQILRGKPDHASVVKFVNSQFNILEYEVTDVINDTNAVLAGEFTNEANLQLIVVGTFDPIALDPSHKNAFQYDSLQMNLNAETVLNTAPGVQPGLTFNLARVSIQGSQVVIEDKRTEFWNTKGAALLSLNETTQNPLFGFEAVKFEHPSTTRIFNIVELGWGFRTTNWTVNSSLNTVTVSGGNGGKFKDSDGFSNGNFDGWRLYTKDGLFSIVKSSIKSGTQFNLELDTLDLNRFSDNAQELIIVPNSDFIEVKATPTPADNTDLPEKFFILPINRGRVRIELLAYHPVSTYNVQYRYKNHFSYSSWLLPLSDTVTGYLTEASFNSDGSLKAPGDRVYQTYTVIDSSVGFLILNQASDAYGNFVNFINLNDKGGVFEITNLEATVAPVASRRFDMTPGVTKQNIIISGSAPLTGDTRLNLDSTGAKNGTSFLVYLKTGIDNLVDTSNFKLEFYADNSTVIYSLTQDQVTKGEQYFRCVFDSNVWYIIHYDIDYGNKETSYQRATEIVNTTDNVEVESAKNVLVVSGYFSHVSVLNNAGIKIDAIRFRNRKFINDFHISASGTAVDLEFNSSNAPSNTADKTFYPIVFDAIDFYPVTSTLKIIMKSTMHFRLVDNQSLTNGAAGALGYRPVGTSKLLSDVTYLTDYVTKVDAYLNDLTRQSTIVAIQDDGSGTGKTITGSAIGGGFTCTQFIGSGTTPSDPFYRYYTLDALVSEWKLSVDVAEAGNIETGSVLANDDNKLGAFKYDIFNVGGFYQIRMICQSSYSSPDVTGEYGPFTLRLLWFKKKNF